MNRLPDHITRRLKLPVIAAPMLRVSGTELVAACCNAGVIGSFPTANARTIEDLEDWVARIKSDLTPEAAPWAANLIIRNPRMPQDLKLLCDQGVELVITSVGSPAAAIGPLHESGALVFGDISTLYHAKKAVEAGVDGLVLLCAGAGGQTGWANPFSFVRAVREFFDGPIALAGGINDGTCLRAAQALGADIGYMGTRFIAAQESMAEDNYKDMLVTATIDDIQQTKTFTGLIANFLRPSILKAGMTMEDLDETMTPERAKSAFGSGALDRPKRWKDIWSAGHTVQAIQTREPAKAIIDRLYGEWMQTEHTAQSS